jgi:hypothetical protein
LEFSQVSVDLDVGNLVIISADDVPAPFCGFDFLHRKPMFFGQLAEALPIQRLEELWVGGIDCMRSGDLNYSFHRFIALKDVTAERCGISIPVCSEHRLAGD